MPWGAFILALLSREQKKEWKNEEQKNGTTENHNRTRWNVLYGDEGLLRREIIRRQKETHSEARMADVWEDMRQWNCGKKLWRLNEWHMGWYWQAKERSLKNVSFRFQMIGKILWKFIWSWIRSCQAIYNIQGCVWGICISSQGSFEFLCQFLLSKFTKWDMKRGTLWSYVWCVSPSRCRIWHCQVPGNETNSRS
jgi:hypothetical protein